MFEKKKPAVETTPQLIPSVPPAEVKISGETLFVSADGKPTTVTPPVQESSPIPEVVPTFVTLPDLMLELEVIGEVFKKRKIYSTQSLKFENGRFTITCHWQPEPGQPIQRFTSRTISSSLTPKGLAMVIAELKAGVGI